MDASDKKIIEKIVDIAFQESLKYKIPVSCELAMIGLFYGRVMAEMEGAMDLVRIVGIIIFRFGASGSYG